MVVAAYLAGLISTPAAVLGVLGGVWWWGRVRRAEAEPELTLEPWVAPPPLPPQEAPVLNRLGFQAVPGRRRNVRGRRRR